MTDKMKWRFKMMSMLKGIARFEWHGSGPCWSGGAAWWLRDNERHPRIELTEHHCSDEDFWAFFGPLLPDDGGVSIVCRKCAGTCWTPKPFCKSEQCECDECGGTGRYDSPLDAVIAHVVMLQMFKGVIS